LDFGTVVILSTINRHGECGPLRSFGSTGRRRVGLVRDESADGDGIRGVESLVLHDDNGARFARIIFGKASRNFSCE
jgi:hypothetical protein